jgi:hypothetical protein
MPFAIGLRWNYVNRVLCPALFVSTLLSLSINTTAQNIFNWTRIQNSKVWAADSSWGPGFGRGDSRFAATNANNIFLSLGSRLLLGDETGLIWKVISSQQEDILNRPFPLATSADGKFIYWGAKFSKDGGQSWNSLGNSGTFNTSYGILEGNRVLAGGGYDALYLSTDAGLTWKEVHFGKTYGNIIGIITTWSNMVFAAPGGDRILVSKDKGTLWTPLNVTLKGQPPQPNLELGRTSYLTMEQKAFQQILWWVVKTQDHTLMIFESPLLFESDSMSVIPHSSSQLPDSSVTAFTVKHNTRTNQTTIWLGTWGQGIFISQDRAKTWIQVNTGLTDLHIEALWVSDQGTALALTRSGLFRITGTPQSSILKSQAYKSDWSDRLDKSAKLRLRHRGSSILIRNQAGDQLNLKGQNSSQAH